MHGRDNVNGIPSLFLDARDRFNRLQFHGLILLLYLISIIHTFDRAHRSGEKFVSQNVKWFSAPLLFYLCDYAMLYINQRFRTEARSFIAMKSQGISRMDC